MSKLRIREAVKLAESHALVILESTDVYAFWGEDFFAEHCEYGEWQVLTKAKNIVLKRIRASRRLAHVEPSVPGKER